jgi:hypothetical protein
MISNIMEWKMKLTTLLSSLKPCAVISQLPDSTISYRNIFLKILFFWDIMLYQWVTTPSDAGYLSQKNGMLNYTNEKILKLIHLFFQISYHNKSSFVTNYIPTIQSLSINKLSNWLSIVVLFKYVNWLTALVFTETV